LSVGSSEVVVIPRLRRFAASLGMTVALATASAAQQPTSSAPPTAQRSRIQPPFRLSVRADNDAFNFWQPIVQRADREYTNGDLVTVELSAAPWWGKRFARNRAACNGLETPGQRCLTTSLHLGQDMYTPRPDHEPGVVPDWRDERPYAAWLFAGAEARVIDARRLRTVSLSLGVTGPQAQGEFAQRTAHKLTGVYSRTPVGWDTQIAFEPGVVLAARDTWRFAARTSSGNAYADFIPNVGATVGNILTAAETGFQVRMGSHLSSSWWTSEWRTRTRFELYALGGLRGLAVAHNITLDGNTLGADRSVDRVPWLGEYMLGVGTRLQDLVVEWRAVTRSREYRTGQPAHAYSTIFASYELPAR
jgi:hypothetical protein